MYIYIYTYPTPCSHDPGPFTVCGAYTAAACLGMGGCLREQKSMKQYRGLKNSFEYPLIVPLYIYTKIIIFTEALLWFQGPYMTEV